MRKETLTINEFIRDEKENPEKYKELWGLVGSIPDYERESPKNAECHFYYDNDELIGGVVVMPLNSAWTDSYISDPAIFNLEIPDRLHKKGIGSMILRDLTSSGKWIAGAYPHNFGFYEKVGFVNSTPSFPNDEVRFYVKGYSEEEISDNEYEFNRLLSDI